MSMPEHRVLPRLLASTRRLLRLRHDTDELGAIARITADVEFRGGTLWALILAILVASVGLNVNSTAVIIGAMLISPLMGPIMGAGLALGINDAVLLRRSGRNLLVAAAASIVTSALYFLVSPLAEAQSELLARTRPTIYDVLIALAGGTAGIVAATRKGDAGNLVPGVAIATALMPPLCTAGFGLATGDFGFFFGALYLFLINAIFICLATLGVVRLLRFRRVLDLDPDHARRIRLVIAAVTTLTILPSLFVAWRVVQESRREAAARRFAAEALSFPDRSFVNTRLAFSRDSTTLETTMLGPPTAAESVAVLAAQLPSFGLTRTRLSVRQPEGGLVSTEQLGLAVRTGILEDLYSRNERALADRDVRIATLEGEVVRLRAEARPVADAVTELAALFPTLRSLQLGREARPVSRAPGTADSTMTAVASWQRLPSMRDRERIRQFLASRLRVDSLRVRHVLD
jgi:uncharacterized hydrophobic protein (TIGR00271 family)